MTAFDSEGPCRYRPLGPAWSGSTGGLEDPDAPRDGDPPEQQAEVPTLTPVRRPSFLMVLLRALSTWGT
jgi:hypothetical protein